ncbi:dead deah box helicase domain-containing protein [Cystoisospora suis]|uniref:Dead deah box helicase domain-containing protein n=1 Tax=Cystoisospora suis TaxID=483139 RepID=A0A2C6KTC8_9APIC|nr:dead deah box helicase domain-containing protein [Cystoisospora suis]
MSCSPFSSTSCFRFSSLPSSSSLSFLQDNCIATRKGRLPLQQHRGWLKIASLLRRFLCHFSFVSRRCLLLTRIFICLFPFNCFSSSASALASFSKDASPPPSFFLSSTSAGSGRDYKDNTSKLFMHQSARRIILPHVSLPLLQTDSFTPPTILSSVRCRSSRESDSGSSGVCTSQRDSTRSENIRLLVPGICVPPTSTRVVAAILMKDQFSRRQSGSSECRSQLSARTPLLPCGSVCTPSDNCVSTKGERSGSALEGDKLPKSSQALLSFVAPEVRTVLLSVPPLCFRFPSSTGNSSFARNARRVVFSSFPSSESPVGDPFSNKVNSGGRTGSYVKCLRFPRGVQRLARQIPYQGCPNFYFSSSGVEQRVHCPNVSSFLSVQSRSREESVLPARLPRQESSFVLAGKDLFTSSFPPPLYPHHVREAKRAFPASGVFAVEGKASTKTRLKCFVGVGEESRGEVSSCPPRGCSTDNDNGNGLVNGFEVKEPERKTTENSSTGDVPESLLDASRQIRDTGKVSDKSEESFHDDERVKKLPGSSLDKEQRDKKEETTKNEEEGRVSGAGVKNEKKEDNQPQQDTCRKEQDGGGVSAAVGDKKEQREQGREDSVEEETEGGDYWSITDPTLEVPPDSFNTQSEVDDESWRRPKKESEGDDEKRKGKKASRKTTNAAPTSTAPEDREGIDGVQLTPKRKRSEREEEVDSSMLLETRGKKSKNTSRRDGRIRLREIENAPRGPLHLVLEKTVPSWEQDIRTNSPSITEVGLSEEDKYEEDDGSTLEQDSRGPSPFSLEPGENRAGNTPLPAVAKKANACQPGHEGTEKKKTTSNLVPARGGELTTRKESEKVYGTTVTPVLRQGEDEKGHDEGQQAEEKGDPLKSQRLLTLLFPEEEAKRRKQQTGASLSKQGGAENGAGTEGQGKTRGKRFSSLGQLISPQTVTALEARNINTMTEVQEKSYAALYEGRDVIARSETGSGKTIGFALPLMEREYRDTLADVASPDGISVQRKSSTIQSSAFYEQPRILILEPTRELARQVAEEVAHLGESLNLTSFCVYGGIPIESQLRRLKREKQRAKGFAGERTPSSGSKSEANRTGHYYTVEGSKSVRSGRLDVLIATPGRLIDLMGLNEDKDVIQTEITLSSVRHVVLDEADEMLKLGFAEDVEKILKAILRPGDNRPTRAQMVLFSATTPPWVEEVASAYLQNPFHVDVLAERKLRTSSTVQHLAVRLPDLPTVGGGGRSSFSSRSSSRSSSKGSRGSSSIASVAGPLLQDLVLAESESGKQAIVFVPTKADADGLANSGGLGGGGVDTAVLHGDIGQETRQAVMEGFRKDVAARGLDIDTVDLVIHCGVPGDADTYIHRSGRTGRAGRAGKSIVLVTPQETRDLERLEQSCGFKFKFVPLPSAASVLRSRADSASRLLDVVSPAVLPTFRSTAQDLLRRAKIGFRNDRCSRPCLVSGLWRSRIFSDHGSPPATCTTGSGWYPRTWTFSFPLPLVTSGGATQIGKSLTSISQLNSQMSF